MNVLLGCVAVVPIWLLWHFLSNYPLAVLGLTRREPTDNDGISSWLLILVPVLTVFVLSWLWLNSWLRRGTGLRARPYWTVSLMLMVLPTIVLVVLSSIP